MRIYGRIYVVTNSSDGKQYVGQTTRSISKRWGEHCAAHGCCRALHAAIKAHGADNFTIQEIAIAHSRDELDRMETEAIAAFDSVSPRGYNLRTGGGSNGTFADETKALCAEISRAAWTDPEYRARAGAGFKRMFSSPEAMKRRAEAVNLARTIPENAERERQGKLAAWARDPARRARMSEQAAARGRDPEFMARWKEVCAPTMRSPEKRAKNRAQMNAQWASPETRAKILAARQRPEVKAARSAIAKALWQNPDFRAKRAATIAAKRVNQEE